MSEENARRGVHVSAGDGIVAHLPSLTAYAKGENERLNELLVRLSALADAGWQETVRTITAAVSEAGFDDHPSIACVSVDDGKLSAFVFGAVELTVVIDGETTVLDGRDSSTWIDVVLRGSVEQIHAGSKQDATLIGILRDGVIPAGGFLLETTGPLPATGQWDAAIQSMSSAESSNDTHSTEVEDLDQVDATEDSAQEDELGSTSDGKPGVSGMFARIEQLSREETSSIIDDLKVEANPTDIGASPEDLGPEDADHDVTESSPESAESSVPATSATDTEAAEASSPAATSTATLWKERPKLRGVTCPLGHFTAPAPICRVCGEAIDSTVSPVTDTRPVLGNLVFDDGAKLDLDRPAVVGANVPQGYTIDDEPTTIVRLDDGHGGVSDVQLEIRCSGWEVEVVDMQSESGTYTMLQGERQTRTRLRSGQAVTLQDGMTVETGTRTFTFGLGPHDEPS